MGIFGFGRPATVQLFGPLAVDGAVIVCEVCGDGGQPGKGHILQVDSSEIRCGKRGHTFTHPAVHELLPAAIRQAPKGAFAVALQDGRTISGSTNVAGVFAGKEGKGKDAKAPKSAGPKGGIAAAQAQAAGKGKAGGARGGGSGGLVAALGTVNAALGTVTATVGAVGQIAGAAGAGARAVGDIAKAGGNAVSLARDHVAGGHQRGLAQLMNADAQAQRQHEQTMAAARYQDAANAREHRTLRSLAQQPKPPQTS
ncbi:hypothetical protein ACIRD3_39460 [Kitasatospora sp. NPDC093550]|uniref:hypothetical protein n=1 Tax=Kitasatospora sp. NPDC093550 TaxID=3364089 RepID=UPI00381B31E8